MKVLHYWHYSTSTDYTDVLYRRLYIRPNIYRPTSNTVVADVTSYRGQAVIVGDFQSKCGGHHPGEGWARK